MIDPCGFVRALAERGFDTWSGVPCSFLTPLLEVVEGEPGLRHVPVANEGDAVAVAVGAHVGGGSAVVYMQNAGLGNAVNPLTSLAHVFETPVLLIVTRRGGADDEPQHALMGDITIQMLELMRVEWQVLPRAPDAWKVVLDGAVAALRERGRSQALVVERGTFAARPHTEACLDAGYTQGGIATAEPPSAPPTRFLGATAGSPQQSATSSPTPVTRVDALRRIRALAQPRDILVASTGYTGRQLYALGDAPNQLYMVGSMGCAASLGLGIALACPARRVIVIDGDGALLMRLGACAAIARQRPPNFVHVVLDNGVHESTGGQPTLSRGVDLPAVALACGYAQVTSDVSALASTSTGPMFVWLATLSGVPTGLPRPTVTPAQVALRLRSALTARA
ncbi:MAG: phosphonopyruvate decarboxylase [Proteobacteria bacterium]|nr:phosphonopyruvate decarboxylase [Pseudomonadota bacterium]